VFPLHNSSSTTHIGDPVIAAAASALAEIDPHKLYFCYCDSPDMELVRLKVNSQCVDCHAVLDMAGVLELTTIDRLELILPATMSPTKQTPTAKKRDLQSLLFDKTPLRLADTLRAESQDKKHENKHEQAKKVIKMQGEDIVNKGAAPGAVVTVKCDYQAVSELSALFTR